jgi:hypothetical protein
MTTRSLSRRSACTKRRWSGPKDHGETLTTSSTQPLTMCGGSTTAASTQASTTTPRSNTNRSITLNMNPASRSLPDKKPSTKPGAIHSAHSERPQSKSLQQRLFGGPCESYPSPIAHFAFCSLCTSLCLSMTLNTRRVDVFLGKLASASQCVAGVDETGCTRTSRVFEPRQDESGPYEW